MPFALPRFCNDSGFHTFLISERNKWKVPLWDISLSSQRADFGASEPADSQVQLNVMKSLNRHVLGWLVLAPAVVSCIDNRVTVMRKDQNIQWGNQNLTGSQGVPIKEKMKTE